MTAPNTITATGEASTGLAPNVGGALAYVLGPFTGIAFLVLEKQNRFIRFHAAQAIVVSIAMFVISFALTILSGILAFIPVLGWIVAMLLSLGLSLIAFVLWISLMWKAYQGESWHAPLVGNAAERLI
jgi:uncharacterized membrane protein